MDPGAYGRHQVSWSDALGFKHCPLAGFLLQVRMAAYFPYFKVSRLNAYLGMIHTLISESL
jgi:hypothetical protein